MKFPMCSVSRFHVRYKFIILVIRIINILVFSLITIVIGLICYEGLVLE